MKLAIHLDAQETYTNIGMAKAMVESNLSVFDLKEIAEHLLVFVENRPILRKDGADND